MSVTFELSVPGETIGRSLAMDSEEAAYALKTLAEHASENFHDEVAEHLWADKGTVATFFRILADRLDAKDIKQQPVHRKGHSHESHP